MPSKEVALWKAPNSLVVSDTTTNVSEIVGAARQLRERERSQIAANLESNHYDVVATFVWHKTMAILKRQLSSLGNQFISELLQNPEIDEYSDLQTAISDSQALSLARDLGILTPTQAMRLAHSQQVIAHFASLDSDEVDDDVGMTPEEALACLRVCVQGILGQESVSVAQDFASFRQKLEHSTLSAESTEVLKLQQSPYFYIRTAISILITLLKSSKGASLEHASRNASLLIPMFWNRLKKPERWQIGQAYASEFQEGRKDSARALNNILLKVQGFDYVPENLRSQTFIKAANAVIAAHQGTNNFYNEPGPMRELASLGSSIPSPALAACMTAVLCVKLGNFYGISYAAQSSADQLISGISEDRWIYYLDGRLEQDRVVLQKLTDDRPLTRWMELMTEIDIDTDQIKTKSVRDLVRASKDGKKVRVLDLGVRLYKAAYNAE